MAGQIKQKLNHLLKLWPACTVITSSQLEKLGIYRQLANAYKKSGWIESIGSGAYILAGNKVDWTGAFYGIRKLNLPIHAGAKTALQLHSHILLLNAKNTVFLFGAIGAKLPTWFKKHKWQNPISYITTNFLPSSVGFIEKKFNNYSIIISVPERAILEMLYLVPQQQNFAEADLFMKTLSYLRPNIVQQLLELCQSIKVKRLFLFLAEKHGLPWLYKLNLEKVNLGTGKRAIVSGGQLDPKYLITVPKQSSVHNYQNDLAIKPIIQEVSVEEA